MIVNQGGGAPKKMQLHTATGFAAIYEMYDSDNEYYRIVIPEGNLPTDFVQQMRKNPNKVTFCVEFNMGSRDSNKNTHSVLYEGWYAPQCSANGMLGQQYYEKYGSENNFCDFVRGIHFEMFADGKIGANVSISAREGFPGLAYTVSDLTLAYMLP